MADTNKEIKHDVITYEKSKIEQTLNLLNTLTVTGLNQANILCNIFNLLNSPVNINEQTTK